MQALCDAHIHIPGEQKQTVALGGDGFNDLRAMQKVPISIAVANGNLIQTI